MKYLLFLRGGCISLQILPQPTLREENGLSVIIFYSNVKLLGDDELGKPTDHWKGHDAALMRLSSNDTLAGARR